MVGSILARNRDEWWRRYLAQEGADMGSLSGMASGTVVALCQRAVVGLTACSQRKLHTNAAQNLCAEIFMSAAPVMVESVMTVSPRTDGCGVPT